VRAGASHFGSENGVGLDSCGAVELVLGILVASGGVAADGAGSGRRELVSVRGSGDGELFTATDANTAITRLEKLQNIDALVGVVMGDELLLVLGKISNSHGFPVGTRAFLNIVQTERNLGGVRVLNENTRVVGSGTGLG
jgi:hypothetical protein